MNNQRRFRRAMVLIFFFSTAASVLIAVILLSIYLPPADPQAQDITVPDLIGTVYTANDPRLPVSLYRVSVEYRTDDEQGAGTILSQSPAPNAVRRVVADKAPCALHLVVSAGKQVTTLPDMTGLRAESAALRLAEMGFAVRREKQSSAAYAVGQVIATRPAAGATLQAGDTVTLIEGATQPRRTLTVPDVVGMTAEQARQALLHAGFVVDELNYRADTLPTDTVVAQFPLGNTLVTSANTRATLTLSDGTLLDPREQSAPLLE